MKEDLPTLGNPQIRIVRAVGSMEGNRAKCWRTCSRYASVDVCFFATVTILADREGVVKGGTEVVHTGICDAKWAESPLHRIEHTTLKRNIQVYHYRIGDGQAKEEKAMKAFAGRENLPKAARFSILHRYNESPYLSRRV